MESDQQKLSSVRSRREYIEKKRELWVPVVQYPKF